ncbi:ciliary microtubule inner protein 4 [Neopsephotus bourkii]|uniref:ciliary microtubule inner protein 4 n=1 Tax=Neopsephotus bourkii TaxID=309878 RepID=UPI002AA58B06|nr:ciliary microtubule inner protein 4 [Neopsephotus bourkii]
MDQVALEVPNPPAPDVTENGSELANSTSVEREKEKKEHFPERRHRTSQRSSSRAQGTAKNRAPAKSQTSCSTKCVQTKKQSKQNLQAKTPPARSLHSRGLEEKKDTSATKDPIVGLEPRGENSTSCPSEIPTQGEAEEVVAGKKQTPSAGRLGSSHKTIKDSYEKAKEMDSTLSAKESLTPLGTDMKGEWNSTSCPSEIPTQGEAEELVAGKKQTPSAGRLGSSHKTIKDSYEKAKEMDSTLSAKGSLTSLGTDMKGEWNPLLAKKNNSIHANRKYKFATADKVTSKEEDRQALCKAALIMGQKRLGDRTGMQKTSSNSASPTDYNQLGFNLRSRIFQGGPLESRSLMKDSYTPDTTQRVIRDPKNWHGRRTDELGKWHEKNALNLNLQKALQDRYREKKASLRR